MTEKYDGGDHEEAGAEQSEGEARAAQIRALNDRLRQRMWGGTILFTTGINAHSFDVKDSILGAIRDFDDFDTGNDPYHEHDFGEVKVGDLRVWFKIDCYDLDMQYASPDPTDERVTRRVMTIMLPGEY